MQNDTGRTLFLFAFKHGAETFSTVSSHGADTFFSASSAKGRTIWLSAVGQTHFSLAVGHGALTFELGFSIAPAPCLRSLRLKVSEESRSRRHIY